MLAAGARAFAAADVVVDASRRGDAIEVVAYAELAVDAATAWRVLTDYDGYARFIPDLAVSRVVARDGPRSIVEQKGAARFLFFRYPLEVRLAVTETPQRTVQSHAVGGNVREMVGRYDIAPRAAGIRFDYTGRIVLAEDGPGLFDVIAVRLNIARQFEALVREIERQAAQ